MPCPEMLYIGKRKAAMVGMVVVQGPGELLFFNQTTYKPGIQVKVGIQPHWMTVSSDGKTVLVTNEGSNNLSTIGIKTGQMTIH
jgi:DNA-binding beta-propeller fold protein YncE